MWGRPDGSRLMTLGIFSAQPTRELRPPSVHVHARTSLPPSTQFSPSTQALQDTPLSLYGIWMESRAPESSKS